MKLRMAENSLFAILLRSPWWISLGLAAIVALVARLALPADLFWFGAFGGLPFVVIAVMAARRQWRAPSAAQLARTAELRPSAPTTRPARTSWPVPPSV